jgi:hypothetical protein
MDMVSTRTVESSKRGRPVVRKFWMIVKTQNKIMTGWRELDVIKA